METKKRIPKKAQERVRLNECVDRVGRIMREYPEFSTVFAVGNEKMSTRSFVGGPIMMFGLCQMLISEINSGVQERELD